MTGIFKRLWNLARSSAMVVLAVFFVKAGADWYLGKTLDDLFGFGAQPQVVKVQCEIKPDAVTTAYAKGFLDGRGWREVAATRPAPEPKRLNWPSRYLNCLRSGKENCGVID